MCPRNLSIYHGRRSFLRSLNEFSLFAGYFSNKLSKLLRYFIVEFNGEATGDNKSFYFFYFRTCGDIFIL